MPRRPKTSDGLSASAIPLAENGSSDPRTHERGVHVGRALEMNWHHRIGDSGDEDDLESVGGDNHPACLGHTASMHV
jgi:hypothetical protein